MQQSFKIEYPGVINQLLSRCIICPAFDPSIQNRPNGNQYNAIWDTGATNSVITNNVAKQLGLTPIGFTEVSHAEGVTKDVPVYLVNIELPNHVGFPFVRVTEGILGDVDVLIGMDIIQRGDFRIENGGGKTTFTYSVPPSEPIPVVKPTTPIVKKKEPGRNDPCPCGSGIKYKNCCGKK